MDKEELKKKFPIFIGVHIGAGYHSTKLRSSYKECINDAIEKTITLLYDKISFVLSNHKGGDGDNNNLLKLNFINSTWIAENVISYLEDNPLTNAGIGSNLNIDGNVECDSSIMSGEFICNCNNNCFDNTINNSNSNNNKIKRICGGGIWGGVGSVSGVLNPIKVAAELLRKQQSVKGSMKSLGRQRPIMLVGKGAKQWASNHGLETFNKKENIIMGDPLITQQSNVNWLKYKSKLENYKDFKQQQQQQEYGLYEEENYEKEEEQDKSNLYDTVGAVVVDWNGNISSGVSSGGIILKHSGRVGEAAIYGAGCWAQNELLLNNNIKLAGVASSATGVGEQLARSLISKEVCLKILKKKFIDTAVKEYFEDSFLSHNDCFSYVNELIINKLSTSTSNKNDKKECINDEDDEDEDEEEEEYSNKNIISNFNGSSRLGGIITLKKETNQLNEMEIEFLWAHSTETMGVGYINSFNSNKPKSFISVNNSNKPGFNFKISSKSFKIPNKK